VEACNITLRGSVMLRILNFMNIWRRLIVEYRSTEAKCHKLPNIKI
jgi:hypothetical protein